MRNFDRLGALATSLTVAVMFVVIVIAAPVLAPLSSSSKAVSILAGAAGSFAVYRGIASGLLSVFRRSVRFRKWMLGPAFLEGTWVGFFPHSGSHHFTVEFFDQETGETKITGREFDANGKTYATWWSHAASVSVADRRLVYTYSCDVFLRDKQQQGIGVFSLISNGKGRAPHVLDGYATDLVIETEGSGQKPIIKKDPNREHKISDAMLDDAAAIARAKELFLKGSDVA
jgi:hypothetical protein